MVPTKIHQTGPSPLPAAYRAEWQQSWKDAHPGYEYSLHTDADLLSLAQAEYSSLAPIFADAATPGVVKGDFGRLLALYVHGGLYADLDFVCLKPLDQLVAKAQASGAKVILSEMRRFPPAYTPSSPRWRFAHNAIMLAEPGHPFIKSVLDGGLATWQASKMKSPEMIAGPMALNYAVWQYAAKDIYISPPDELCPLSYMNAGNPPGTAARTELAEDTIEQMRTFWPDAYAVTFWLHQW